MSEPRFLWSRSRRDRSMGFTLMEVMIVVAIVSFLMAIALPSYQESMRKGRRADAKAGLMDIANRQERFMLDRGTYTDDLTNLGYGSATVTSEEGHYTLGVVTPDGTCPIGNCYVLTATPVAGGAQDGDSRCTRFLLNSDGVRTAEGSTNSVCW